MGHPSYRNISIRRHKDTHPPISRLWRNVLAKQQPPSLREALNVVARNARPLIRLMTPRRRCHRSLRWDSVDRWAGSMSIGSTDSLGSLDLSAEAAPVDLSIDAAKVAQISSSCTEVIPTPRHAWNPIARRTCRCPLLDTSVLSNTGLRAMTTSRSTQKHERLSLVVSQHHQSIQGLAACRGRTVLNVTL